MRRTTTSARPVAACTATLALFILTGCERRAVDESAADAAAAESARSSAEVSTSSSMQGADPFAGFEAKERKVSSRRVPAARTKAQQLKLVDDPAWREAVEKAHQAEIIFRAAGRSWDRGSLSSAERNEIKRGKALLGDAADATWQLEQDLGADPSQRSLFEAVSKVRTMWIERMREVGKLVRG